MWGAGVCQRSAQFLRTLQGIPDWDAMKIKLVFSSATCTVIVLLKGPIVLFPACGAVSGTWEQSVVSLVSAGHTLQPLWSQGVVDSTDSVHGCS